MPFEAIRQRVAREPRCILPHGLRAGTDRQASQRDRVVRIDLTRCFVVTDRIVFTTKPLEHLRGVEIAG